ncbi:hypothetical protein HDU98_002462 [Podochytrium sp. JEL0797]|nr:hypothetical protein HDU98_002462 [Podochytrium sp. JEL0797]
MHGITFTKALKLDVYPSKNAQSPVIVVIHGGIWQFGNREREAGFAQTLQTKGYTVVVPDYTLYPAGICEDMLDDVSAALDWTATNIKNFNGDSNRISLLGHSAGAHLAATAVLHGLLPDRGGMRQLKHSIPKLDSMILLGGCYNLPGQMSHEANRLHTQMKLKQMIKNVIEKAMHGADNAEPLIHRSPYFILNELTDKEKALLPKRWLLIHSEHDNVISYKETVAFEENLKDRIDDVQTQLIVVKEKATASFGDKLYGMEFELDVEHQRLVDELKAPANTRYAVDALAAIATVTKL